MLRDNLTTYIVYHFRELLHNRQYAKSVDNLTLDIIDFYTRVFFID